MANKNLFSSKNASTNEVEVCDTVNNAGGVAYKKEKKAVLAQIAATNCFNGTFYASAEDNLKLAKDAVLELKDDPEFIAKVALYSREKAYMKDMPAFLTVLLSEINKPLFRKVFRKVVDNGKMLRNVIQMARSGAVGKKKNMSAGTYRKAIQEWFNAKSSKALFKASIGNDPSMKDILAMAKPKPNSVEKNALFGYFVGKKFEFDLLPEIVQQYEKWKLTKEGPVPDVDFRMLDSLGLSDKDWTKIAENASWTMTRMNLNTFARHGVFKDERVTKIVAERLKRREDIESARAFPYQLYTAWLATNINDDVPFIVKEAMQDAMEISIDNVPEFEGNVHVCCDQSGSMNSPVTGSTAGRHASVVTCAQVVGLIASAVVRKNHSATVWTFNNSAVKVNLNPRDTVFTNAKKLSSAGGGTNVAVPLAEMNRLNSKADVILYISDYESWISGKSYGYGTALANEWKAFKSKNPKAKLICCDLTPNAHCQIKEQKDVLQVGGFSDGVWEVIASFIKNGNDGDHWVDEIEKVSLDL